MKTKKILALALAAVLLVAVSVAGTIAYLTATSAPVENTFKTSTVSVSIAETTGTEYQVIPGVNITKDPVVTYTTNVDSYVYVKMTKTEWDDAMTFEMGKDWKKLDGYENVWYYEVVITEGANNVAASTTGTLQVIADNTITVPGNIDFDKESKLAFTPYICQKAPANDPVEAWETYLNSGN